MDNLSDPNDTQRNNNTMSFFFNINNWSQMNKGN